MKIILIAFSAFLSSAARAQDEQWGKEVAITELRQLVLTRTPMGTWARRKEQAAAWIGKVQEKGIELGKQSFLMSVALYFSGDHAGAGKGMAEYLTKHKKLPSKDFNMIAGRIMLGYAITSLRAKDMQGAKKAIPMALALYSDPMMIYRLVGRQLLGSSVDGSKKTLNELLARALTDARLSDTDKQNLLKGIYAAQPRAGNRAAGRKRDTGPKPLKAFSATDIDGDSITLDKYKGRVVLVDFWATWCGPCMREMPHVVKAYEDFHARGFEVIGISLDKEPGQKRGGAVIAAKKGGATMMKIRDAMKKASMTWPIIYEGGYWSTRLAKENGIRSIPATFLIDRKGKVRFTNLRGAALAEKVKELLEEKR